MGIASSTKFIKNNLGTLTEQAAVTTSAGASDAQAIPALNAAGILDDSVINAKSTSTGAADAARIPKLNAAGVLDASIVNSKTTSLGAGDTGKLVALDGSGRIDQTMMPVGLGADIVSIMTSEALAAGDFVNIFNSAGAKVRKADATVAGKEAHGFVLSAVASGVAADVYFEGSNTSVTGRTPGSVFLSTTAGLSTSVAPSGSGNVVQRIGFATSATSINFQSQPPVVLA